MEENILGNINFGNISSELQISDLQVYTDLSFVYLRGNKLLNKSINIDLLCFKIENIDGTIISNIENYIIEEKNSNLILKYKNTGSPISIEASKEIAFGKIKYREPEPEPEPEPETSYTDDVFIILDARTNVLYEGKEILNYEPEPELYIIYEPEPEPPEPEPEPEPPEPEPEPEPEAESPEPEPEPESPEPEPEPMPEPEPEPEVKEPEPEPELIGIGVIVKGYLNDSNYVKVDKLDFNNDFKYVIDNSYAVNNIVTFSTTHISSSTYENSDISAALIKSLTDDSYYYLRKHPVSNSIEKKIKVNDYLLPLN